MNLLTKIKSPTSSVGRIDDDGILNGSARNERNKNTISRTGKNAFEYSTHDGSRNAAASICSRWATAGAVASAAGADGRCRSKWAIAARARSRRRPSRTSLSTSHAKPVSAVNKKRIRAKFIVRRDVVGIYVLHRSMTMAAARYCAPETANEDSFLADLQ